MVGVLGLGVAAATWPGDKTQTAYPAPAAQPVLAESAAPEARELEQRRTTPSATPSPTRKPSAKPSAKPKASAKPTAKAKASVKAEPKAKPVAKVKPKVLPDPPLKVTDTKYATASLNVRAGASFDSDVIDVVSAGDKISVTSAVRSGFRFISYNDRGRWISDKYLSAKKPVVRSSTEGSSSGSGSGSSGGGISAAACSKSSSIQSGLTPNAIKVYRALCARYPQISSFGGRRPGDSGFHGTGRALDVMISTSSVGWDIAEWTRANAGTLGVSEVIYYQKIWTVERSSEGWRPMSDRGSASANHYDHVHVSVY